MKAKLKEREAELKKKQLAKLKERQAKKEATEKKHHINRVQLTNKMTQIGGSWKAEEIPVHLQQLLTEKQQKEALYVQLHFHRDVLRAQGPRQLFQKSRKDCLFVCGISLTSGQLVSEFFPDCTRSCFSKVVLRRRGGDRIYEMRCLFVAVGPNARFIVLPHWDNMS